jgi:hypothetical protein
MSFLQKKIFIPTCSQYSQFTSDFSSGLGKKDISAPLISTTFIHFSFVYILVREGQKPWLGNPPEIRRNSAEFRIPVLFLVYFSDLLSDSDRKVLSRHFFNIPESIPAINFLIFFPRKTVPAIFSPSERRSAKRTSTPHDPPTGHLLVFEKKATYRECSFVGKRRGGGG